MKKTYLTIFFNFISRGVALHRYIGPCVQLARSPSIYGIRANCGKIVGKCKKNVHDNCRNNVEKI